MWHIHIWNVNKGKIQNIDACNNKYEHLKQYYPYKKLKQNITMCDRIYTNSRKNKAVII